MNVRPLAGLARNRRLRAAVQLVFVVFVLYRAYAHIGVNPGSQPSLDSLCPMGGVASLYTLFTTGGLVSKIHASAVVLAIGLLASVIIAGGVFCGWVCPLGSLGDAMAAIGRRLGLREVAIPPGVERYLGLLKWVVLGLVVYFTAVGAQLAFAPYDPYRTVFSLHWIFEPSAADWPGYLMAGLVIVAGLFVRRAWCRFFCPLGALMQLFGHLRVCRISRSTGACIDCGLCDKACPSGLGVSTSVKTPSACTNCLDCMAVCPAKGALAMTVGSGSGKKSIGNDKGVGRNVR